VFVGLVFMATGIFFLVREIQTPPTHNTHIYIFAGFIGFGGLLIVPGPFVDALKAVSPFLPKLPRGGDSP
jgi:hypothetical protein